MVPPKLFLPSFTNIPQLRPVHDGIEALIPGFHTQAGFLQETLKGPIISLVNRFHIVHYVHAPLTMLFRHKVGLLMSHRFVQCSV